MAEPIPDSLSRADADAKLPPFVIAKNHVYFDRAEDYAARLVEHLGIVERNAKLGLAHDLKTSTKTATWLFRELIAAVNAIEEAP